MAVADPARCRLRMTDAELTAVATLGQSGPAAAEDSRQLLADALTTAGVLTGGTVPGWVDELLRAVAQPALRVAVETVTVGPPLVRQLWANPRDATLGEPVDGGMTELSWLDPVTVLSVIATLLRFRRRPPPTEATVIRLLASQFAAFEKRSTARNTATADPPPGGVLTTSDAEVLGRIMARRRVTWRVSTVWADATDSRRSGDLCVIDGGDAGLWEVSIPDRGSEDPVVQLEAVAPSTVWRRLVALLPALTAARGEAMA